MPRVRVAGSYAAGMTDCIFCAIIDGSASARIVYSDNSAIAFLDTKPVQPGHTLVIPRRHTPDLSGISADDGAAVFAAARRIGAALRASTIAADGVHLVVNDGRAACQTVFHSHMHVIPRHRGDRISFARGFVARRDSNPDATAEVIRTALDAAPA